MNAYTPPASSAVLANKSSNNSVTANAAESKRLNYSAEVRSILLLWLGQNREYPYPSDAVKNDLAVKTGLTLQQVNNWFINARRRKYQFMLEDVPTGSPGSSTSISTPPVHPVPQHTPPAQDTLIVTTPRLTSTGSTPSNSFSSHASSSSSHLRASFSSTMQSPSISSDTDRRMSAAGFGPGRRRAFSGNAAAAMSGTPPSHSPYWKTAAESLALQQQHQPTPQYPPSGSDHTVRSLGSFSNSSNLTSGENSSSKISPPVIIARGPSPLSGIDRPTRDLFLRQQQQQQQLSNQSAGLGRHQQMLHHQPYKLPAYNLSSYSVGNSSKSVTTAASVQPSPFAGNRTGTQLVVRPYILGAGNSSGHESTQQNKLVLPFPSPPFQQQQQQQKQPQQQQHATHRHSISLPQPVTYTSGANTREGDGFSVGSVVVNTLTMAGEGSAELAPLRPLFSQNKDGYNLEAQEKLRLEGRPRLESMFAKLSTDRSEAMNRLKGSEVSNLEGPLTDAMQVDEANVHKKREVYGVGGYEVSRGCLMEGERAVAEASMRMKERDAIWGICNDD
ncbi:hypothetical protein BJ741DRAFT_601067 [Chytriomyces cf. hyalinus JEL632]|nr:hypothetical protein BJ741DRAFT_601067 [Chytriomyces cf. hyalinus JEL632]